LPEEILLEETPFLEQQDMLRAVDDQRKREDPDFKGAFHEKKRRPGQAAAGKKPASSKSPGKTGPKNFRSKKTSNFRSGALSNKKKR
jgi:ATP-dependent RNA helicase RhlE